MKKFLKRLAVLAGIAAVGYLAYFATAVAGIAFFPEVVGTCLNYVGLGAIGVFGIAAVKAIRDTVKDIFNAKEEKEVTPKKAEPQKGKENQKENENQRVQHRAHERPQQTVNREEQKKMMKRWMGKHRATKTAGGRDNQRQAA